MNNPLISIIIINYNTFDLTCACIQSVFDQTSRVLYEIILVDNQSTDVNPDEFVKKFPSLVLVRNKMNVGFAKGNNLGIERAKGEFILLLNSDTLFKNNVPKILHDFLTHHQRVAAVSSRLEFPDGTVQHNCQRFPRVKTKLFEVLRLQKMVSRNVGGKVLLGSFFDHNSIIFPDWTWGTCFMFRRALLDQLTDKKLAEGFFLYGEDVQWCKEFRMLGYEIAYTPHAQTIHYMGKSGGAKTEMMRVNMDQFMNKYYNPIERKLIKFLDSILSKA